MLYRIFEGSLDLGFLYFVRMWLELVKIMDLVGFCFFVILVFYKVGRGGWL